ncbi:hypothetical protein TNCV_1033331 [Trichonephila clavipes]|nr:hypothetical protein TNCV_1033331 [Trichonephila clavipes]
MFCRKNTHRKRKQTRVESDSQCPAVVTESVHLSHEQSQPILAIPSHHHLSGRYFSPRRSGPLTKGMSVSRPPPRESHCPQGCRGEENPVIRYCCLKGDNDNFFSRFGWLTKNETKRKKGIRRKEFVTPRKYFHRRTAGTHSTLQFQNSPTQGREHDGRKKKQPSSLFFN